MGLVAAASVAGNTFPIFLPWYSRTREMSGSDEEALLGADREDNTITVKIKTMLDDHNIDIKVSRDGEQVADLKRKVMEALHAQGKNIRLICCGKLLDPPSAQLKSFSNIKEGAFIHAVVSSHTSNVGSTSGNNNTRSANPNGNGSGSGNGDGESLNSNIGFNRLHMMGFSPEEIAVVRATFQAQVDELSSTTPRNEGESDQEYRERVEQRWMSTQGPYSEFSINLPQTQSGILGRNSRVFMFSNGLGDMDEEFGGTQVGTYRDFIWGFFMGFMLGFLMLFCVWDRHVPHRQKIGILLGVFMSIMLDNSRAAAAASSTHSRMRGSNPGSVPQPQQPLDPAAISGGAYNVGDGGDPLVRDPPSIISIGT